MFIGFFAFVLTQGPTLARDVVNSLYQIGAGGGSASPAEVFDAGIRVASKMSEQAKFGVFEDNALAIAAVLAMGVVVICFSLVAAIFVAVMVEMYVGLLAGMIMLGLGGSSFTKDFAIRYLVYAFGVGMKLMALVMIAKIGSEVLLGLAQAPTADSDQFITTLAIAGISVVCLSSRCTCQLLSRGWFKVRLSQAAWKPSATGGRLHHLHLARRRSRQAPSEPAPRRLSQRAQPDPLLQAQHFVGWEPVSGPLERLRARLPRRRRSVRPEHTPARSWGLPTPSSIRAARDKAVPKRRQYATTSNHQEGRNRWQQTGRPIALTLPRGRNGLNDMDPMSKPRAHGGSSAFSDFRWP